MATYATLSYGSSGDNVKKLQTKLNAAGYNLAVDGGFGAKTQAAVKDYQKKNGLAVDGVVGSETWGSLNTAKSSAAAKPAKGTGSSVLSGVSRNTQANLNKYSGGYKPSDTVTAAQKYLEQLQSQKPGAYESKWTEQLNEMYDKVMGRDDFTYDLADDPLYQQYRDQYVNLGQNAMLDTMGQAAGLTGGYGSTYSQNAGQQAYQGYLQQLNDKVPELYRMARDNYDQEGQKLLEQYGLILDRDATDYGRYRDTVADFLSERDFAQGQYDSERTFDYGKYADMLQYWQNKAQQENGDYWTKAQFDYQKARDAIADEQWAKEFALSRQKAYSSGSSGGGSGGSSGGGTKPTFNKKGISTKRTTDTNTGRVSASAWEYVKNNIRTNLRNGNYTNVDKYMGQISSDLSKEQWNEIADMLNQYGYNVQKY